MTPQVRENLKKIKESCLIFDIETSSHYPDGREVSIRANFDDYVALAKVKFFGAYSYKYKQTYYLNALTHSFKIKQLLNEHKILVGFNSEDFDYPIIVNNRLTNGFVRYNNVDCMAILGTATSKNRKGFPYKNRGALMNYAFKKNSLKFIAEAMELETQKGSIDYKIFHKDSWTEEETKEIIKYLSGDILATKGMFDKLWEYWIPFTELLDEKSIYNLSWIKNSIASLTYKSACHFMGVEPTYSEKKGKKEEMGGRVVDPKFEEKEKVWYVDVASLYPHIMACFNIFAETEDKTAWHGNDMFQVKGYYNISKRHILSEKVAERLKERMTLKKNDPENSLVYTLKIWLNCFAENSQVVMGDHSIKYIKDCKIGEVIWSINPKTLYAEKKKITKTFMYNYIGEMHHYKGNYFNFNVTPNHKFLLHKVNNDNKSFSEAKFLESKDINSNYKLPIHKSKKKNYIKNINILDYFPKDYFLYSIKSNTEHGRSFLHRYNLKNKYLQYNCTDRHFIFEYDAIKNVYNKLIKNKDLTVQIFKKGRRKEHKKPIIYNNNALSYLIGIYLAEGSTHKTEAKQYKNTLRGETYSISLSQYKDVNNDIYNKITNALDKCGLKYSPGKQAIKVSGSIFYDFIINNFGKLGYKHFINKELFNVLNLNKVWEGLIDGDGTKKARLYTTKYDCLKNDFIELCMRLGYTFVIKNDGCWRITYNKNRNVFRPTHRTVENYNGKVYCIEVEDNNTLLAGCNNKFNWSGNSLYGVVRSALFEQIHTPNGGWDVCWIGQQIHIYMEKRMSEFGFNSIMGDTDSHFLIARDEIYNNKEYVIQCLQKIVEEIKANMPFPVDTFKIDIEDYIEYLMCPFSDQMIVDEKTRKNITEKIKKGVEEFDVEGYEIQIIDKKICVIETASNKVVKRGRTWIKERRGRKKNYIYLVEKDRELKLKIVGLPIKKVNATPLGMKIFKEVLEPEILKTKKAKFPKEFIDGKINEYLDKPDIMELLAREFRVNATSTYKLEGQIQAQISRGYFNCGEGIIRLIKNSKVGNAGKGMKYCTVQEAIDNKLKVDDLDLDKVNAELEAFIA